MLARSFRQRAASDLVTGKVGTSARKFCPWNSFATPSTEKAFLAREGLDGPRLIEWMTMTQEAFSARFKGSPIKRAKRRSLLRNAAVALGNWGSPDALPALAVALNDEEPLVRGHAAWAHRHASGAAGAAGEGRGGGGRVGARGDRDRAVVDFE